MPFFGKKTKENKAERPKPASSKQTASSKKVVSSKNETSYFGKNLMIKGRVSGNGDIIILGGLDGEFNLRGRVKVAQSAKIKGEVKADVISVNGSVKGSLAAKERIHLDKTARIEGQMMTPKLSISEGASFDGEISMNERLSTPFRSEKRDPATDAQSTNTPAKK
jgi:cytoskeletal protein CcmA (bactofilin family)